MRINDCQYITFEAPSYAEAGSYTPSNLKLLSLPKPMNYPKLFSVGFLMAGPISASAIELGQSQILTSSEQVPEGLTAADWSNIRSTTRKQVYLKSSNTDADDRFGWAVAVSGDTVVVGAYGEDSNALGVNATLGQANNSASSAGAAYVFIRSGKTWVQQAYLKASNAGAVDHFGISVAISGDTIVIGAEGEDSNAKGVNDPVGQESNTAGGAGAAYVFIRSGSNWSQQAYLKASNTGQFDNFGWAVAVSGDTIVVGAPSEDSSAVGVNDPIGQAKNNADGSGAAYVFTRSGNIWSQQAYLKASNTGANNFFGSSVAISKDKVVVGAPSENSNATSVNNPIGQVNNGATGAGAAYLFVRTGVTWSQQAYLKASNTDAGDSFGRSVAISGDTLAVGAPAESSNAVGVNDPVGQTDNSVGNSGASYIFHYNGGNWIQEAYLKSSRKIPYASFGSSVAVSDEKVVVGAPNGYGAGGFVAAYVYARKSGIWSEQAHPKAKNWGVDDRWSVAVAISGETIIAGHQAESSSSSGVNSIPSFTGTADASGAAYIFELPVVKFLVKVKVSNAKFGKVTGVGSFKEGSSVTLRATSEKGRTFLGWYEDKKFISKRKVLVIKTLIANRNIVAKFK